MRCTDASSQGSRSYELHGSGELAQGCWYETVECWLGERLTWSRVGSGFRRRRASHLARKVAVGNAGVNHVGHAGQHGSCQGRVGQCQPGQPHHQHLSVTLQHLPRPERTCGMSVSSSSMIQDVNAILIGVTSRVCGEICNCCLLRMPVAQLLQAISSMSCLDRAGMA